MPAGLRDLVVRQSGGNPLYIEEVVRSLIASGALRREADGWRCTVDTAALEVPATLQGLLLSRVDRLPAAARRLVQEASVLGLTVDASLLRAVASEPSGCQSALTSPRGRRAPRGGDRARGSDTRAGILGAAVPVHERARARGDLSEPPRSPTVGLHDRAGRALEALVERGDRPRRLEDLEALGYHFGRSADRIKGARHLVAAGDWARAIYANADAVRNYEHALPTLAECGPGDAEHGRVEERLADVLGLMGRREAALGRFRTALGAVEASGDRPAQARLHRKMAALHWNAGQRELARQTLERGLALLDGHGQHIELAHLYQEMGRLLFRGGDSAGAIVWAERALAQAERLVPHGGPIRARTRGDPEGGGRRGLARLQYPRRRAGTRRSPR